MSSIPAALLKQEAMLATPSKGQPLETISRLAATGRYVFDLKYDGARALAYVDKGEVQLRSRSGENVTAVYPEVVARLAEMLPHATVVLDGELICFDPQTGLPSFNRMQKRLAQSKPARIRELVKVMPVSLVAFDLLFAGEDLREKPLVDRLKRLQSYAPCIGADQRVLLSQSSPHGDSMWQFVETHGLEGLIAKDKSGRYSGRRDTGWVKLKRLKRCTAIVTGYEPGKGARRGKIGALLVSVLDDAGALVAIGKAGSGLKESDHGPFLEVLDAGQQFLAEIEYLGLTPGGELRMPVFKGVRSDVSRNECLLSQVRT